MKEEPLSYLDDRRRKCRATIESPMDENAFRLCKVRWDEVVHLELLLDNMRHVQEHAAQLNLYLGQRHGSEAVWVSQSKQPTDAQR
jgi:hypothetical protein